MVSYHARELRYFEMVNTQIKRALAADAPGIVAVLKVIVAERVHSAIERAWTVEQEARYLESLSPREALHVAVDATEGIVGFQSLDLWARLLTSMAHVGQLGTFTRMARKGCGSAIVDCHRILCPSGRLSEADCSGSRVEYRRTGVLPALGIS